jgi:molecular chaperone HscB
MNPFEILGLEAGIDINKEDLEERYLSLSREYHPDFNQGLAAEQQVAMLTRSAELNDAYKLLRNPWSRAETTITILDPEAMEATKTLQPDFLMEAMEMREEADDATPEESSAMQAGVTDQIHAYLQSINAAIKTGQLREAATLVHQSNYYRKALEALRDKVEGS